MPNKTIELTNYYTNYFTKTPQIEYRIEDYLYKPSAEPIASKQSNNLKTNNGSSLIKQAISTQSSHSITSDLSRKSETKSKSSIEFRNQPKNNSKTASELESEPKLMSIIKDLKVTLETYLERNKGQDSDKIDEKEILNVLVKSNPKGIVVNQ